MSSILPGFEYDIFISYRHNDNRSGWITEFVKSLQEELASTIKEPISVYFDTNPHDGLLETHNVDKSLEGKLKCLIFIPMISQTYCDPKSFAWQHEFCAFNKMAKDDQFGRDIKLSNGNVASRILPVKIHDLDAEDRTLLENEIGGVLRAIEFIYKEAGVNRPLKPTDGKNDNLNRTDYRNQVNKVANAIKEILSSMKNPSSISALTIGNRQSVTDRQPSSRLKKGLIASLVLIVLATAGYFLYPTLFSSGKKDELDKSIAVLPFADMSPGKDQEYFGDGIAEEIINGLAQVNNLKVIARSSSFQFKGRNEDLKTIGEMLGVATVLEGSIKKSGDKIRVTATLSKATDRTQLWSETFDRNLVDYLLIQDEITHRIVGALKVSFSGKQEPSRRMSTSEEAIKLYQQGRYFYDRNGQGDTKIALDYFSLSVKIDTGFALAWAYRAQSAGLIDSTLTNWRQYNQTALGLDPNLADAHINLGLLYWSDLNFVEAEKELRTALFLEGGNPRVLRLAGRFLGYLGFYQEGLELCKKAVDLDPLQAWSYQSLTHAFAVNGLFGDALIAWRRENEISKRDGSSTQTHLLVLNGQVKEALDLVNKINEEQERLFLLTLIYHINNQRVKSDEYFQMFKDKFGSINPLSVNEILVFCGKKEEALSKLHNAFLVKKIRWPSADEQFRFAPYLKGSPYLIPIRNEPRFKDCARKWNYPE